ncbi:MAG: hypothetical protein KF901_15420 [Myxococcales bacterium]|nr:hypothetical protein [Myxococcales bacterium]
MGAGLAGLSVAVHLACRRVDQRVVLLDARERYDGDRTWCQLAVRPHPFEACVTKRWSQIEVHAPQEVGGACARRRLDVRRTPYVHLDAERVYARARDELARAGMTLELGVHVEAVRPRRDHVVVQTSKGVLRARAVLDSRPRPSNQAAGDTPSAGTSPALAQHFRGFFVRSEAPLFDPDVATLMDFRVDQRVALAAGGLRFVYVLPFDAHHALVEDTYFTPEVFPLGDEALAPFAAQARLTVEREERGVIPMTTARPDDEPRHRRIGLAGGVAKPSTGYAFDFIQRHAEVIADAVARGRPIPSYQRMSWLDEVFLGVLRARPEAAPMLFGRLFARAPAGSLVRFLTETATPLDAARVMAALPPPPFLAESARAVARRLRLPA